MRLFFAVPISDAVREAVGSLIADLKLSQADFKWVDPENLHLTLSFLGDTPEDKLPGLRQTLSEAAAGQASFEAAFGALGAFDSLEHPRVLWIGIASGLEPLRALASRLPPEKEKREFAAHLTIGRMGNARNLKVLQERIKSAPRAFGSMRVERVCLFESRLSSSGPKYAVVAEAML